MGYEKVIEANKLRAKHNKHKSRVYQIWAGMKYRCTNPNSSVWKRYGGRGITLCKAWRKFEKFYDDMGDPPSRQHTLDRINNNRGYSPSNCRWATRKQQSRNTSANTWVEFGGKRMTWVEWAEHLNVPYNLLMTRVKKRKSLHEVLKPRVDAKHGALVSFMGQSLTLREWSKKLRVPYQTIWYRHKNGKPLI
jgi:hypothetical protein